MEYKFPDGFWWGALHLRRNQKVRLMAMEKQKTYGIIGIILSRTDFMRKLDRLKHPRFIRIIIKIFC